jgi:hypothetical protein
LTQMPPAPLQSTTSLVLLISRLRLEGIRFSKTVLTHWSARVSAQRSVKNHLELCSKVSLPLMKVVSKKNTSSFSSKSSLIRTTLCSCTILTIGYIISREELTSHHSILS